MAPPDKIPASGPPAAPVDVDVEAEAKVEGGADVEAPAADKPEAKPEAKPKPKAASEGSPYKTDSFQWLPMFGAGVQWGANGFNDSGLFPKHFGQVGDFTNFHFSPKLMTNINLAGPDLRFIFGGQIALDLMRGSVETGSADLNQITIGPEIGLDWRGAWGTTIAGPSDFGVRYGIGYGWGEMPAETIRKFEQSGLAHTLGANITAASLELGPFRLDADVIGMTQVVDGKDFNSAGNFIGVALVGQPSMRKEPEGETKIIKEPAPEPKIEEKEVCPSLQESIGTKGAAINGADGLKGKVEAAEKAVAARKAHIESRDVDPLNVETIRDILRKQYVEQAVAGGTDPVKAEEDAKGKYPDDFNFWKAKPGMPSDSDIQIPDPLPEDCNELGELLKKLQKAEDDLKGRLADLERIEKTPFPPRIREVVTKVISKVQPNLKDVHFNDDRPTPWDLRGAQMAMKKATKSDGLIDFSDRTVRKYFNAIFGASYVDKMLKSLKEVADNLNDGLMKEVKNIEVQGHTSLKGSAAHNKSLSDRRARIVTDILVGMGVAKDRLIPKGYGEEQPKVPNEEQLPHGSTDRADAEATNRRIELKPPDESELKRVEGLSNKKSVPGPSGGGSSPKKTPPVDIKKDDLDE